MTTTDEPQWEEMTDFPLVGELVRHCSYYWKGTKREHVYFLILDVEHVPAFIEDGSFFCRLTAWCLNDNKLRMPCIEYEGVHKRIINHPKFHWERVRKQHD